MLDRRKKESHKGDNGKVMVIGGSPMFYGAPILCALGAEASGADLVFPFIPPEHVEAAKSYSLNFIIHPFQQSAITLADVDAIVEFHTKADVVVIGPGLEQDTDTANVLKALLPQLKRPTVIDAGALIETSIYPAITILTPHRGEFKALTGDDPTPENVQKWAGTLGVIMVCKGPQDVIANREMIALNETGNAAMTVGGTGDVLSGLIAGLISQGITPLDACEMATNVLGVCAENLTHLQSSVRALDLIHHIPVMMHKLSD